MVRKWLLEIRGGTEGIRSWIQTLGEGLCLLQTSVQGKGLELGAKPCHMAVAPALFQSVDFLLSLCRGLWV